MDETGVAWTNIVLETGEMPTLRMAGFRVANSTANFDDGDLSFVIIVIAVETAFDLSGDVGG